MIFLSSMDQRILFVKMLTNAHNLVAATPMPLVRKLLVGLRSAHATLDIPEMVYQATARRSINVPLEIMDPPLVIPMRNAQMTGLRGNVTAAQGSQASLPLWMTLKMQFAFHAKLVTTKLDLVMVGAQTVTPVPIRAIKQLSVPCVVMVITPMRQVMRASNVPRNLPIAALLLQLTLELPLVLAFRATKTPRLIL
jgi:hypothetical protein